MLLILEAIALIALIGSLGSVARVWLSAWGAVLPPLLTDATIAVDARRAGRFLRSLLGALVDDRQAARSNRDRITDDEALALLGAAVAEDTKGIGTLAEALDTEPAVLGVVATFAAMPVLHACRRSLAPQLLPGYVKTLTVLRATPPERIALVDLASVELDIAALENGYGRPSALARRRPARVIPV